MDNTEDSIANGQMFNDPLELELSDIHFRKDLLDYIIVLSKNIPSSVRNVSGVCEHLLIPVTIPFCKKWSGKIEYHAGHIKRYFSFILKLNNARILVPHQILCYFTLNPENHLIENLQRSLGSKQRFYFYFNNIFRELNLDLSRIDQAIIEVFLNPIIREKYPRIPNNGQIAELLQVNENTVARRTELMYLKSILSHFYHIDVSRLGYETYAFIHQNEVSVNSSLSVFQLVSVPIDFGESQGYISIYQIPYRRTQVLLRLREELNANYEILLTKSYMGFNLTGFTANTGRRWRILPPILQGGSWSQKLVSSGYGFENDLVSCEALKLTQTQAKMLDLIQLGTSSNTYLSKTLSINRKYVREFFYYFMDKAIIRRFTMLQNIGLDVKMWITIIGPHSNECINSLSQIIEHLKFFPFNYLFYTDGSISTNDRVLITGLIRIPSSWLVDFAGNFLGLTELGFNPKYVVSKGSIRWGININQTYDFDTGV